MEKPMFQKPFSFKDRIRRREYALSWLINFLFWNFTLIVLDNGSVGFISIGVFIILFCFFIAQGAKRSHDINRSGWWQLVPFYVVLLLFIDGNSGENRFGEDPKGRGEPQPKQEG